MQEKKEIASPSFFIGRGNQGDDDIISFGSGQPDLPPPPEAYEVIQDYRGFRYGLVQGSESLRAALAEEYPNATADQFVITNGASEAIDLVLRAVSTEGGLPAQAGVVLLPRPYYYSYPSNVELADMTPRFYDLDETGKIVFETFEQMVNELGDTLRVVLINSPSNPTGTVQEIETLKKIEALCTERGIYILSDEVYKDLIYERENYLIQGPRVVTVNSFSKTYAMCGLRVGYLYTTNAEVLEKTIEIKTHTSMNTSIVGQAMALGAIKMRSVYIDQHLPIWHERRDIMLAGMEKLGLPLMKPEGAFYVLPKLLHATRAMHDLFYNYDVITYDGAWFGAPDHLRFSYALEVPRIEEGLARVERFLNNEYKNYK